MIDPKTLKRAMLGAALRLMPPIIRDDALTDVKLQDEFDLEAASLVNFPGVNVTFNSQLLAAAVQAAASRHQRRRLVDRSGAEWEVIAHVGKGELILRSGSRSLRLDHLLLMTGNRKARQTIVAREIKEFNLPTGIADHWRRIATTRRLSQDEVRTFVTEISRTPVAIGRMISEQLAKGNVSLEVLVPRSLDYYERLVGRIEGQRDIREYAKEVAGEHIRKLLEWHAVEGLRQSLLMGSHSAIVDELAKFAISTAEFHDLAQWARNFDAIAREVTLELAIRKVNGKADIGESACALAERFCGQGAEERYDQFDILSALFIMVDGELCATRTFTSKPPFWRRLAALAQASLIVRCILSSAMDHSQFVDWAKSVRYLAHRVQCYADLRQEPLWLPAFAEPGQLKNEIGGRLLVIAATNEKATKELGLRDLLLAENEQSLKSQLNVTMAMLPGPLEGNIEPLRQLSSGQLAEMRSRLAEPLPTVSSFAPMGNAALLFQLPDDLPILAVDAVRRAHHRIAADGDESKFESCLVGLAIAAAVKRHRQLADEILTVIRYYRRLSREEIDLDGAFRIGIIACASRADLQGWCQCVGALVGDLGFGELTREEAEALHMIVIRLCELVPELWATCARGLAAIEAVAS
jgi:hypothetical protein